MTRKRSIGRKLLSTDGKSFELSALGIKERDARIANSTKLREHKLLELANKRQETRAKKHNAVKALEYILASQGL